MAYTVNSSFEDFMRDSVNLAPERTTTLIDDKLDDLNASHGEIDYTIIYRIQDGIYSHRKVAYKIPDFFYNMTRNKHENSTHIIVGQIVDKLKRNKRRAECV